ncbi:MAG TPA: hypothetical protein VE994_21605 [Terriglobales bacterium]|nr:hypothetical protein [Terriglobales bacterium]
MGFPQTIREHSHKPICGIGSGQALEVTLIPKVFADDALRVGASPLSHCVGDAGHIYKNVAPHIRDFAVLVHELAARSLVRAA